ncbi:hypothetical protein [Henriciella sp.]|uniref:hypothetical protein n=1 Tax=Henriciella sp. TaxID=1968823 RepID=UPI0026274507|nr:hypothetical protein [Henriciella sp.]
MLFCIILTGCAGSLGSSSDAGSATPDWYEARKAEFQGKGYPKLSRVPANTSYEARQSGLVKTADEREALRTAFFNDPRSATVSMTPAEIRAWGLEKRQQVVSLDTPSDFLTEEEITSLFALFERPRARR